MTNVMFMYLNEPVWLHLWCLRVPFYFSGNSLTASRHEEMKMRFQLDDFRLFVPAKPHSAWCAAAAAVTAWAVKLRETTSQLISLLPSADEFQWIILHFISIIMVSGCVGGFLWDGWHLFLCSLTLLTDFIGRQLLQWIITDRIYITITLLSQTAIRFIFQQVD